MTTAMPAHIPQWIVPPIPEGTYVLYESTEGGRPRLGVLVAWLADVAHVAGLRPGGWKRPKPASVVATASSWDLAAIEDRPAAPKGVEARLLPEIAPMRRAMLITATGLKRERNWTESLIEAYLGEADVEKCNPHYRSGPPMRLYRLGRVEDAEATAQWQAAQQRSSQKRDSARCAARTKYSRTMTAVEDALEEHPPEVPLMSRDDLDGKARASWFERASARRHYDGGSPGPEHADRLAVNYLRHELTDYEDRLASIHGLTGKNDALEKIRVAIYDAIADAYPDLETECSRQVASRRADALW